MTCGERKQVRRPTADAPAAPVRTTVRARAAGVVALAACACAVDAALAAPPSIRNLGSLYGPGRSVGAAVSETGVVAGTSTRDSSFADVAYTWTESRGLVPLGTLGGTDSSASGISRDGEVVAGAARFGLNDHKPYRWTPQTGMQQLGTVGGFASGSGLDANHSGTIVGESVSFLGGRRYVATRWAPGEGPQGLGTLGGANSSAQAVNAAGDIVGWVDLDGVSSRAFLWTASQGMRVLPGLENRHSVARDVSDTGYVTGFSGNTPMLWRGELLSSDLGLPPEFVGGSGTGIAVNNHGIVVGSVYHFSLPQGEPTRAMLWRLGGTVVNLDEWLDAQDPAAGAHWTLTDATGVTDSGLITGTGTFNDGPGGMPDGRRAFLLDASSLIPEPSAVSFVATGLLLLARRRGRAGGLHAALHACAPPAAWPHSGQRSGVARTS